MKAMELGNFVRDERTCNTFDATGSETEITQLKEAIKRLPERARYVLVRRYGLDDTRPATLAELGAELRSHASGYDSPSDRRRRPSELIVVSRLSARALRRDAAARKPKG